MTKGRAYDDKYNAMQNTYVNWHWLSKIK